MRAGVSECMVVIGIDRVDVNIVSVSGTVGGNMLGALLGDGLVVANALVKGKLVDGMVVTDCLLVGVVLVVDVVVCEMRRAMTQFLVIGCVVDLSGIMTGAAAEFCDTSSESVEVKD